MINELKTKCSEMIPDGNWHDHQCTRKAVIKRNGKAYCKIHDPEYIKLKDKKAKEKYDNARCKKCKYHFDYKHYVYCPLCGLKRK